MNLRNLRFFFLVLLIFLIIQKNLIVGILILGIFLYWRFFKRKSYSNNKDQQILRSIAENLKEISTQIKESSHGGDDFQSFPSEMSLLPSQNQFSSQREENYEENEFSSVN